ncbi:MAG: hypothetical protein JRH15_18760 [Deltaproteobacteria bacterium]|nr:hypothetical protein [Deltaproteobacteria bacterium]
MHAVQSLRNTGTSHGDVGHLVIDDGFNGYVSLENYRSFVCVNGHAYRGEKSENTNFATQIKTTEDPDSISSRKILDNNEAYCYICIKMLHKL